ncbi:MAG: BrnT family toxin [Desulfomonile tiedjei]|uniref:BrnT family toxin n=1 Tax=Desulfomonile tiedjei TaxID=2358 RepID=A0A9D6V3B8_9BACT|nr:BrnT family toxin [Desulfomonile tiedjei]
MNKDDKRVVQGCSFTWDTRKANSNHTKHGVSFLEAVDVLFDPHYYAEDASAEGEERYAVIGHSKKGRLLYVVKDEGDEAWRIISARPVTSQERIRYEEETNSR